MGVIRTFLVTTAVVLAACMAAAESVADPAQWIWEEGAREPNVWVAFRTELDLQTLPVRAPARIAVDSKYWLWINNELIVFEGGLKRGPRPGATWVDEIDLAPYLEPGVNSIAVLVWYWGRDGFSHVDSGHGGLFLELEAAGSTMGTGADWKAMRHPAYLSSTQGEQPNFRLPEHNIRFDARLNTIDGWKSPGFDDSGWPSAVEVGEPPEGPWGELVARRVPMLRFTGVLDPVRTLSVDAGDTRVLIAGLPANLQVTPLIEIEAPPGLLIDIRTDNYTIGASNSVRSEYVTRGGHQTFEALAWFNGDELRFTVPDGVEILRLGYRESGYDTAFAGAFWSSDATLDDLWRKAARTTYVNLRDGFMDCPDRERAQWWGDVVNEMVQAFYAFDPAVNALSEKAIHDLVAWRKNGVILTSPVPSGNFDDELPAQMLAAIGRFGIWQYILHSGDAAILDRVLDSTLDYLALWQEDATGLVVQRPGDWQWFDWGNNIDGEVIENAWYAIALDGAARMARLQGSAGTANELETRLGRLAAGFDDVFWTGSDYRSQDHDGPPDDRANALAVLAGIVPQSRFDAMRSVLMGQRYASPYMERFVLEALFEIGHDDAALARMRLRFGPMVADPATTLWEKWNRDAGSDNHGWAGGPLIVLSSRIAGLAPETPGWTRYRVRPQLAQLSEAGARVETVRGPVSAIHRRSDAEHTLDLTSPAGTTAVVVMPALGLGGGRVYEVSVDGSVVWPSGVDQPVPGVTFVEVTPEGVVFEVIPGEWSFRSRSTPGLLFCDGFEEGDPSAWD